MPKLGMDVRILGLLTSSDYSTLTFDEYTELHRSIGRKCAEIIFEALAEEKMIKVDLSATIYETANELINIATRLMFGSELQFLNVKYRMNGDLSFLNIEIEKCPICDYVKSSNPVCNLLSAFFSRLIERFISQFAKVKVDSIEESCIAKGDSLCNFTIKWRTPIGLPIPRKHEVEIHIDEEALKEKVREIEDLDFYRRVIAYTRKKS